MKKLLFEMTREQALAYGLLACGNCKHPENNHFDWGKKTCARCKCEGYLEVARVGRLVNAKKKD